MDHTRRFAALLMVPLLGAATVSAQTPFRHSGSESKHSTFAAAPNESVDPASGALNAGRHRPGAPR